jgi:hypothetical protein
MLAPKIVQVPDFSEFIGKEFIVTEYFDDSDKYNKKTRSNKEKILGRPIKKGVRFKISKIKNGTVTVKVTSSKKQLEELGMLEFDQKRCVSDHKQEIKELKKLIKMWEEEADQFVPKEGQSWYKESGKSTGSFVDCDKSVDKRGFTYDGVTVRTCTYERKDGVNNFHSYHRGRNEYFNKAFYEAKLKYAKIDLEGWKKMDNFRRWCIFRLLQKKVEVKIEDLNTMKF